MIMEAPTPIWVVRCGGPSGNGAMLAYDDLPEFEWWVADLAEACNRGLFDVAAAYGPLRWDAEELRQEAWRILSAEGRFRVRADRGGFTIEIQVSHLRRVKKL